VQLLILIEASDFTGDHAPTTKQLTRICAARKARPDMTTNRTRESARIYQFPAGGRAGLEARRDGPKTAVQPATQNVAVTACGSGWYHDEAVREAELTRKR
jgi:hypothetical protein